jgi:hypothetical protein
MVGAGVLFGYLSAFVTIVVALAVADLVTSLHRLIRARERVKWRLLPQLATAFIYLSLMTEFFEIWRFTAFTRLSFYGLLFNMSEPLLAFLAAAAVLPDEVPPEGLDLDTFYFHERGYIWGAMFLGLIASTIINVIERPLQRLAFDAASLRFWGETVLLAIALLVLVWSRRRWLHALCIVVMLAVAQAGYSIWALQGLPAIVSAQPTHSAH